jgi:Zn-dependent metalloprotease
MKNINKYPQIVALTLLFTWHCALAQQKQAALTEVILEESSKTSWLYFKPESKVDASTVFEIYKSNFGLSVNDEMRNFRTNEMPVTGIKVSRFHQYHNGYRVMGATMNVHSRDGIALKANGKLVKNFTTESKSAITENSALQKALDFIPAKDYAWLDQRKVEKMRLKKKDTNYTLYPKGELVYVQAKNKKEYKSEDFILCWKFDVGMSRSNSQRVFIDANTGEVIKNIPLDATCNGTTIDLPYNGNQTVYTSQQGRCSNGNYYEMWDDCISAYIHVEDYDTGDPKCNNSTSNTWTNLSGTTSDAAQVNWGMRKTYQYHLSHFNWTSYDDVGGSIDCTVGFNFIDDNGNVSGNNARWTWADEDFDFGYGVSGINDSDSYTTLDIVAHEFTHGVDEFSANLDYSDESGALDESFADIFGEIVEMATENNWTNPTWLHAEDRTNVNYHRSFIQPNDKDHPDTYLGNHWYSGSGDNGGVHTNSSVQNHFFYLLVEGGSDVNDIGNHYNVTGISINDAIDIAWAAHQYLFDAAEYIDARDAWIEAAIDLFGSCSNQAIQVGNAWHAVGVGGQSPYYTTAVIGTVSAINANKTYEAINHVYSTGLTNVNSISGAKEVRFYAGNEVTLNVGFTAPSGCAFKAKINPCSVTMHSAIRYSNETSSNEIKKETAALSSSLAVIPNPFQTTFSCRFNSSGNEQEGLLTMYDAMGKTVMKSQHHIADGRNEINIDASTIPSGLYHLVLTTNGGNSYSQKIIKQ